MAYFNLARRTIAVCVLCQATAGSTFAQDPNQPVPRSNHLLQRINEIEALQIRINDKLSQMNSVAELSAHGRLDPAVNIMAVEVTQLKKLLAQRAAQLEKRYAEMRKADVKSALRADEIPVAGDTPRQSVRQQFPQLGAGPWRKLELDGKQYYLIPVEEIDGPESSAEGKPKIFPPSSGQLRR